MLFIEPAVPSILGGYELIERVARGGMASLYLARRAGARGFVRPVAVKLVHPHLLEDPDFVEMFIDEANVCSRLAHPNIVHVEELGEADGNLYLVMEFVEGCSLARLLSFAQKKKKRLPLPLAVNLIISAADGLHAAHETRGDRNEPLEIVHRDVSPSNLLLSRRGTVKIIDFGIAKFANRQHHTRSMKLKGKVAYMSPEQLQRGPIDRRSDIYSLGVVLWETLANRRAYRSKDEVALLQMVLSSPVPPIESIRDDLPDDLIAALHQALQRDADARFETAFELRQALAAAVPQALLVASKDIGEFVRRAMESDGENGTSQQRVRSQAQRSVPEDGHDTLTPSDGSNDGELAASSVPSGRANRKLWAGVGLAAVAAVTLATLALWPQPTPAPVELPAPPAAREETAAVTAPQPPPAEVAKSERTEKAEAIEEAEAAEVEHAEAVAPRRRPQHKRTRRKRTVAAIEPQAVPTYLLQEETAPPTGQTRVDDVLLADEDEIDRAVVRGAAKKKAKVVKQDGADLADEYQ